MNYAIITTYTYDASGNIAEIIDCNGNKTTYTYDSCGRTVAVIDAAGDKSEIVYDLMGNPVKVILPEGVTESYTYDSEGRLLTVTDSLLNTTTYTYDNYGRVKSITDAVGVCTEYEYDIAGNVTKNLLTGEEYVYNVYGEVIKYIDGEGNITEYTYDGQGNVTEVMDALGNVTGYTYRKDGLLATIRDANGAVTEYTYNERGLITSETDPLGAVTTYLYDKEDRVVKVTTPDGTITEYTYNSDSNVTSITATKADGESSVLRYLYALDGSLTASISDTDILTYAYDAKGQLTELQKNGTHRLGFDYDSNGNLLWLKESADGNPYRVDNVTGYEYDAAGRLTAVYADGKSSYKFVENHHTGSKDAREYYTGGTLLAQYTYNADGTQKTVTDGAGNVTSYTYTAYKQVAEFETVSANGSLLYREKNTYDASGSLLERMTSGSTSAVNTSEYVYDDLDRLVSETVDGITTSYTYDTMGNRVSKTEDGVQTTYTYDLCNKLLGEVTEGAQTNVVITYLYDGIGNLMEKVTSEGTTTYTYDALHQLTKTINPDGTWQESTYDASGIRSMLSENGITTEYMSYNGLALTGYNTSGEQTEHYCYGTSLLAAELATSVNENKTGTNLYYYIKNSHGDVIGLSDNDGTLTETYTYDAFGTLTSIQTLNKNGILTETETAVSRFLYAGEQYDSITGLYYLRARRYDTTAGRFTQKDTYLGDGRNLYVYVGNNPLKYVDPSGYCSKKTMEDRVNDLYVQMSNDALTNYDPVKMQLEKESRERTWKGILEKIKGTVVTGIGLLGIYAAVSFPPSAPLAAPLVFGGLGGTTAVMGLSDMSEGDQDIYYGIIGDVTTQAVNPVRDYSFGGDQEAYDAAEFFVSALTTSYGLLAPSFTTAVTYGGISQYANIDVLAGEISSSNTALAQYGDTFGKMGTYIEKSNVYVNWNSYAEHGLERMQQRDMTREMVNNIVEHGKVLSQNNGNKYAYITRDGVVVLSKEGKLITAWSSEYFDSNMWEIIRKLFGE